MLDSLRCLIHRAARTLLSCALLAAGPGVSQNAGAQDSSGEVRLGDVAPPHQAYRLTPDKHGRAAFMVLPTGPDARFGEAVTLALQHFSDASGEPLALAFADDAGSTELAARIGQAVTLQLPLPFDGKRVWGGVLVTRDDDVAAVLPLEIARFGPAVVGDDADVAPDGAGYLRIAIGSLRSYGETANFELSPLRGAGGITQATFLDNSVVPARPVETLEVALPADVDVIDLPFLARDLTPGKEYVGVLRTRVGGETFLNVPLTFERASWAEDSAFSPIQSSRADREATLILSPQADRPLAGISVLARDQEGTDVDPENDFEVLLKNDDEVISLWSLDVTDALEVSRRTIQPGSRMEVLVRPRKDLPVGTHDVQLVFSALNVASDDWPETEVTFEVRREPYWSVLVLVVAIVVSYMTTKGLATALRRRNLRRRISRLRRTSWLRHDRWGALPVVRDFGRIAMADKAMRHKHGMTRFLRVVTTPELIADLVDVVEKRIPVLERITKLAVFWKAAPMDYGVIVDGVDPMVVRRAQKILRRIVDQLSQIPDDEEVPNDIVARIEALEAWKDFETLEAGYWTSLRGDMQLLLSAVRLTEFATDEAALARLGSTLKLAAAEKDKPESRDQLAGLIEAMDHVPRLGTADLRLRVEPLLTKLADPDATMQALRDVESSPREIARRLREIIADVAVPGDLNAMIQREIDYAYLKLLWEQRRDQERQEQILEFVREGAPVEAAFDYLDQDVWERLKKEGVVQIADPELGHRIEEYDPVDLHVNCTDPKADTYLFKHGLQFEWEITFAKRALRPITKSTTVTQFIPTQGEVTAGVVMRYGNDAHAVPPVRFTTFPTSRFDQLWPIPTTEVIGLMISFALALVAGIQSDAFLTSLTGSWSDYAELFVWGVAADQTRNLLQNLDTFTQGQDAAQAQA